MNTRNYVQEGGGIQLGKSGRVNGEMDLTLKTSPSRWSKNSRHIHPMTLRFTDLRAHVLGLEEFDDDPKTSNEPKLEAIQMAWHEEYNDSKS